MVEWRNTSDVSWFYACVRCWRLTHLWDSCKLIVDVLLDLADSLLKFAQAGLQLKRCSGCGLHVLSGLLCS